jgi:hypothetical protein
MLSKSYGKLTVAVSAENSFLTRLGTFIRVRVTRWANFRQSVDVFLCPVFFFVAEEAQILCLFFMSQKLSIIFD